MQFIYKSEVNDRADTFIVKIEDANQDACVKR